MIGKLCSRSIIAFDQLDYASKLRFMTTVTTNGMLYPKFAEQLVGKVDALLFSIDSTDADEHDRIRAMKSFHLVLEALAVARKLRQSLYISHVVTNESFDNVDEMIRFAKDQGAILYLNPCFSFFGNEGLDPEKAKGLEQVLRQAGVIVDPRAARAHRRRRQQEGGPGVPRGLVHGRHLAREQAAAALLPLQPAGAPHRGQALRPLRRTRSCRQAKRMEGRHHFCEGCTVYCYMRSSLQWKYPVESAAMTAIYFRERIRQKIRNFVDPPNPAPIPVPAVRRHLPLAEPGE